MTREAFKQVLDAKGYSYKIEGNRVVVTDEGVVYLKDLTSLPSDVEFRNDGGIELSALTFLPPGVEFRNGGYVSLHSLTSISPGVEFRNEWSVRLDALIGGELDDWEGNIEDIKSKRLLNVMIKRGMFI